MSLPPPAESQAFQVVSALEAGIIGLLDEMFITGAVPGKMTFPPSLSFLLQHSSTKSKLVFDLGIRKDWENLPPPVVEWVRKVFPVSIPQDVVESLTLGGLSTDDIDYVCLSHFHFDHIGDTAPFKRSTFLVTKDSIPLFDPGYPTDPTAACTSDLIPSDRRKVLDASSWPPLGPFPHALDFYNDGSLYLIDAPGHLLGHVNVLARTSADGAWIYLAGDSAHHWNLITGKSEIPVGHPGHDGGCAHDNKAEAEVHIGRIRDLMKLPRVRVLLAHDDPWYVENKGGAAFLPGSIPSL